MGEVSVRARNFPLVRSGISGSLSRRRRSVPWRHQLKHTPLSNFSSLPSRVGGRERSSIVRKVEKESSSCSVKLWRRAPKTDNAVVCLEADYNFYKLCCIRPRAFYFPFSDDGEKGK